MRDLIQYLMTAMFTGAVQVTEVRMRARLVSIFVKIVQLRIQLKSKMDQHAFADFKEQITAVGDDKSRLRLFKTW